MGGDDGSSISRTAKDVYSYSLHYYDDAGRSDYRPIGRAVVPAPFSNFEQVGGSVSSPLYNGNIAAMGVQIDYGAGGGGQGTGLREPLLYGYRYDQLNRLVGMQAHRNLVNNQWRPVALDDYREWVSYDANGNIRSYDRNGTTTAYGTPAAGHALEMDRLSYGYTEVSLNGRQVLTSNRLRHVKDAISDAGRYMEDIDNQADDNYRYDAIGNLVQDQQGGNAEIRWTVYGKIAGIHKTDGTQVYYGYDAAGNRISKTVDRSGSSKPSAGVTTTWYVRDAQGNVLSTYEKRGSSPLEQTELHLYGSSRLGIQRTSLVVEGSVIPLYTYSTETLVRGRKLYELSNHLGNVLATITDKKVLVADGGSAGGTGGVCANGGLVEVLDVYNRDGSLSSYRARQEINFYSNFESGSGDEWEGYIDAGATICDNSGGGGTGSGMPAGAYYVADLVSATDYAPFGMGLVGRTYNAGLYKYGYNGKERDQDIGEDNYDYGMRISDQRLGRFLSVDPLTRSYAQLTPYQYAGNTPVQAIDLDGLEYATIIYKYYGTRGPVLQVKWYDDKQHNSYGNLGEGVAFQTQRYNEKGQLTSTSPISMFKRSSMWDHGFYYGPTQLPQVWMVANYKLEAVDAADEAGRIHDMHYDVVGANADNGLDSWATIEADKGIMAATATIMNAKIGSPDPFNKQPITRSERDAANRAYTYFRLASASKIDEVSGWMEKNYSSIAKKASGTFNDNEEDQKYNYGLFRDKYMHFNSSQNAWERNDGMWKQNGDKTWVPLTPDELKL